MNTISLYVAQFLSFMHSPAFKGLLIVAALLFDIFTTSLGMAPFVFKKLDLLFAHTSLPKSTGAIFSVIVCALAATLASGSLTVASMHRKHISAFCIGTVVFVVSFGGVASGMFNIRSFADLHFDTVINLTAVLAFTGGPILYYSLNSGLVYEQFGSEIQAINVANAEHIKTSLIASAKEAITADTTAKEAKVKKGLIGHLRSLNRSNTQILTLNKTA